MMDDLEHYRTRDLLQLMEYSLGQDNPVRAEVITLIQNTEAGRGNLDMITLMSRGFGGPTDSNALMALAAEIQHQMEMRSGIEYSTDVLSNVKPNNILENQPETLQSIPSSTTWI